MATYACFKCGSLRVSLADQHLTCSKCGHILRLQTYNKRLAEGAKAYRYGVRVRRYREAQLAKERKYGPPKYKSAPSIGVDTLLWAYVGSSILLGLSSMFAGEFVKQLLQDLLKNLKRRSLPSGPSQPFEELFAVESDIEALQRLVDNDAAFDHFRQQILDHHNNLNNVDPRVKAYVQAEQKGGEVQTILEREGRVIQQLRSESVFVSDQGRRYHTKACVRLKGSKKKMTLHDANKVLEPCSSCLGILRKGRSRILNPTPEVWRG